MGNGSYAMQSTWSNDTNRCDISHPIISNGGGSNDFSISASPTSLTISQGSNATSKISTAVTSGSAGTVSLTASVSPSGPTASLSPTSVTADGSSTLTVTVGSTVATGSYTVTVTGTEGSAQHSTTVSVTVHHRVAAALPMAALRRGRSRAGPRVARPQSIRARTAARTLVRQVRPRQPMAADRSSRRSQPPVGRVH